MSLAPLSPRQRTGPRRDPLQSLTATDSSHSFNLHGDAQAVLRNLYHKFHWSYGCPQSGYMKDRWKLACRGLVHFNYITQDLQLTQKGWEYLESNAKEFTRHA